MQDLAQESLNGELTEEKLNRVLTIVSNTYGKYADSIPNDIYYLQIQPVSGILWWICSCLDPDGSRDYVKVLQTAGSHDASWLYEQRDAHLDQISKQYGKTPAIRNLLNKYHTRLKGHLTFQASSAYDKGFFQLAAIASGIAILLAAFYAGEAAASDKSRALSAILKRTVFASLSYLAVMGFFTVLYIGINGTEALTSLFAVFQSDPAIITHQATDFTPAAEKWQFISGAGLKIIACIAMVIDHVGAVILESLEDTAMWTLRIRTADHVLRTIGRLAFPLFCFLLVEGFFHTHNRRKYALRLLLSALISEIPFDLALSGTWFDMSYQNVMFQLLADFLMLCALQKIRTKPGWNKCRRYLSALGIAALTSLIANYVLRCDYGLSGTLLLLTLYLTRRNRCLQTFSGAAAQFQSEPSCVFSFLLLPFYNGKRGRQAKYFFYWFYPIHLLILSLLSSLRSPSR